MAKKTIKARVDNLEAGGGEQPHVVIVQDETNPDRWHEHLYPKGEGLTWDQVTERYPNHTIIRIVYVDNLEGDNENGV
jgi:hypothetical protein